MKEWLEVVAWIVTLLVVLAFVVFCATYAIRLLGKRFSPLHSGSGSITVVDRAYVGQDRQLLIVKAANKALLIGVTSSHIEKLCDLDPDQLPVISSQTQDSSFKTLLKGFLTKEQDREKNEEEEAGA